MLQGLLVSCFDGLVAYQRLFVSLSLALVECGSLDDETQMDGLGGGKERAAKEGCDLGEGWTREGGTKSRKVR